MDNDELIWQNEVLEMARQADVWVAGQEPYQSQLEAFAKLVEERTAAKVRKATLEEMIYEHPTTAIEKAVAYEREGLVRIIEANIAAEREACAKMCDATEGAEGKDLAQAIRARGEQHEQ
jgi:hypothetical protein